MIRANLEHTVGEEERVRRAKEGLRKMMEKSTITFPPGADLKKLARERGN